MTMGLCAAARGGGARLEVRVGAQVEDDQQLAVAIGVDLTLGAPLRPLEVTNHLSA